jgi:subtilisin family serine protease
MKLPNKTMALALSCFTLSACSYEPTAEELAQESAVELGTSTKFLKSADAIPGQYIVVLKDAEVSAGRVPEVAQSLATRHGASVTQTYAHALRGFAMKANEAAARALAHNPQVAYVEEDGLVTTTGLQGSPTWGLDRIDQSDLPLNSQYRYGKTGSGVHAYIIDTGISTSHSDFGGRASGSFTSISDGNGTNDCNGHGTHVAGTVGSATYGVAKGVTLHGVRVLGCDGSGTTAGVISGVEWVTANHVKPAVANMSLGGGLSTSLNTAVSNSITAGVVYAVAAGNNGADACSYSPASASTALTVGATSSADAKASWSNYGSCLDLFAPGVSILSTSSSGGTTTMSGTSMASPHVAGAAALYLEGSPSATPAQVGAALLGYAGSGKVSSPGTNSPNLLLSTVPLTAEQGVLYTWGELARGASLSSSSGNAVLSHQTDGNLVIYNQGVALWATGTHGQSTLKFTLQGDGNMVLYSSTAALWASGSQGKGGVRLVMQNDCNLVLYTASGSAVWASGTSCR